MNRYLLWNPAKVASHNGNADTFEELLQTESQHDCSWSSLITTDDIEAVVTAIQNECDVDISYKEISVFT